MKQAGRSLHIGLNGVDPAGYAGWSGTLTACEFDARDMQELARVQEFRTELLLTAEATSDAVLEGLSATADALDPGDLFLLTYSGHGGSLEDVSGDEEDDHKDETWALFDRQLLDDELYEAFKRFKPGVRILVTSDSCHSGSVVRTMPDGSEVACRVMPKSTRIEAFGRNRSMYEGLKERSAGVRGSSPSASIILVSGCQDDQESADGARNGLFTEKLREVWDNGAFEGTHQEFCQTIAARMPQDQEPNYFTDGVANQAFEDQRPFTI